VSELWWTIIGAAVGGSGLVGLLFFFLRRYIEQKLTGAEAEDSRRRELRIQRTQIEDELHHAYGRVLFWVHRYIETNQHNGELQKAFETLQEVEARKKELDRQIIAQAEHDQK